MSLFSKIAIITLIFLPAISYIYYFYVVRMKTASASREIAKREIIKTTLAVSLYLTLTLGFLGEFDKSLASSRAFDILVSLPHIVFVVSFWIAILDRPKEH